MSKNKFKVIEGGAGENPELTILLTETERQYLLEECIIDDPAIIKTIEAAPFDGKNYRLTLSDEDMEDLDGCVSFNFNHEKIKKKKKICEGILDKTDHAVYGEEGLDTDEIIRKEILREQLKEVINIQIRENNPPETKLAYDRLMKQFNDKDEVIKCIGCVVVSEIFNVLNKNETYNKERYTGKLNKLPDLSWMKDEEGSSGK